MIHGPRVGKCAPPFCFLFVLPHVFARVEALWCAFGASEQDAAALRNPSFPPTPVVVQARLKRCFFPAPPSTQAQSGIMNYNDWTAGALAPSPHNYTCQTDA